MQRLAKRLKQLQREEEKLQADRTVTAEQMAKRGSAALLQEKYRQERETLENLLRGWEQACQELEENKVHTATESGKETICGKIIRRWNRYFWMRRREFWRKN